MSPELQRTLGLAAKLGTALDPVNPGDHDTLRQALTTLVYAARADMLAELLRKGAELHQTEIKRVAP